MKIYQYIFRDCDSDDIKTIQSTNLYRANSMAYDEYLSWWKDGEERDYWGDPKETFVEFCKHYVKNIYGGHMFDSGISVEIVRNDFDVEV